MFVMNNVLNVIILILSKPNCIEKKCKNNYYYYLNDYSNYIQKNNLCYEKCNTCNETEIGDDINNKCDSCKYNYDYISKDKNCIILIQIKDFLF